MPEIKDSVPLWGVDLGVTKNGNRAHVAYVSAPDEASAGQPVLRDSGTWLCWN